jgi:hypothetical protein
MGGGVSALSAEAYTATLYVMVNIVKGGERAPPPPRSPARADFTIMTECTLEIGQSFICLHVHVFHKNPEKKLYLKTGSKIHRQESSGGGVTCISRRL